MRLPSLTRPLYLALALLFAPLPANAGWLQWILDLGKAEKAAEAERVVIVLASVYVQVGLHAGRHS
jgi:hypothetical protein